MFRRAGKILGRAARRSGWGTTGRSLRSNCATRAIREVRKAQPDRARPVVVQLRGGTYYLQDTWTLHDADSGTAASPTIYEAYPGETPILSGGVPISGWQKDDAGRWRTKVPDVVAGAWTFQQLYVNDQRRQRPVLPRDGYYFIDAPAGGTQAGRQDRFQFADGHIRGDWRNLPDVEVLPFHSWCISRIPIAQVDAAHAPCDAGRRHHAAALVRAE